MARIFVSHSSRDNAAAAALSGWLRDNGWDDVFVDFDADRGIAAGERWEEALNKAASRCEAVIFLVSRNWIASEWCTREFDLARRLSKRLFGVLIDDIPLADIPWRISGTWQFTDLNAGEDHEVFPVVVPPDGRREHVTLSAGGLQRLRAGLLKAGLDARFFPWPPEHDRDRAPFRGLAALESDDAGIFFGREAPLIEAMDTLRSLAGRAAPRLCVIQGASGAGKSSFLRAGLVPRLARDDRLFHPLPIVRPSRAALLGDTGFVEALLRALDAKGMPMKRSALRRLVDDKDAVAERLSALAARMRAPAMPGEAPARSPVIVLPVDQAEELFQAEGAAESARFLELLRHLTETDRLVPSGSDPLRVMVLFTIRTDAYGPLQSAPALAELRQTVFSLAPMPRGAFQTVIEGPARRRTVEGNKPLEVEPALTAALLNDIEEGGGRDALPLLAFTLQRLFVEHGGDGKLTLADYQSSGRLIGAIEAAVAHAFSEADRDPAVPRDPKARLALLRRGMIPWLAGVDPTTNLARRKVARLSEIPEEARPLIRHLIDARLLSTDRAPGSDEATVELAHEALLRQWAVLAGWLQIDLGLLSTLEGVLSATRDWEANARAEAWLAHTAGRLEDAEQLLNRPDLMAEDTDKPEHRRAEIGRKLGPAERRYLTACRAADTARRDRELADARRVAEEAERRAMAERLARSRTMAGLVVALVLLTVAMASGFYAFDRQQAAEVALQAESEALRAAETEQRAAEAERQAAMASAEEAERQAKAARQSQINAMVAWALSQAETDPAAAIRLVLAAWPDSEEGPFPTQSLAYGALSAALVATRPHDAWPSQQSEIEKIVFSPDGKHIVSAGKDGTLKFWDAVTGDPVGEPLSGHEGSVYGLAFSSDGKRLVSGGADGTVRLWDALEGKPIGDPLLDHRGFVGSVHFLRDETRILSAGHDGAFRLWDVETGDLLGAYPIEEPWRRIEKVAVSYDGSRMASLDGDGGFTMWDLNPEGVPGNPVPWYGAALGTTGFSFNGDGTRIVLGDWQGTVAIFDDEGEFAVGPAIKEHSGRVGNALFSPDGSRVATSAADGTIRLWNADTGTPLGKGILGHLGSIDSIAFSPDGLKIVSGGSDGILRLWDVSFGVPLTPPMTRNLDVTTWSDAEVMSTIFSLDGSRIISGDRTGTISLWDAETGAASGWQHFQAHDRGQTHDGAVLSLALSPDGSRFASSGMDGTIRLWATETGMALGKPWQAHEDYVHSIVFLPGSDRIVSAGADGMIRQWNANTGEELEEPVYGGGQYIYDLAVSSDGNRLVSGSNDGSLHLWTVQYGALLRIPRLFSRLEGEANSVAISSDGKVVFAAGWKGTITRRDAETGASLGRPLIRHEEPVRHIAVLPGGNRLVSADKDNILLWDAETGAPLGDPISNDGQGFETVEFSPDGTRIVSGDVNGELLLWANLPPGNILQVACRYLPHINGRPDTSTDGLAAELGLDGLSLPADCDTYDPPIPPLTPTVPPAHD